MKRICLVLALLCVLPLTACGGESREKAYYYTILCGQDGSTLRTLPEEDPDRQLLDSFMLELAERAAEGFSELPGELTVRLQFVQYQETTASVQKDRPAQNREYEEVARLVIYLDSDLVTLRYPAGPVQSDSLELHYQADPEEIEALYRLIL